MTKESTMVTAKYAPVQVPTPPPYPGQQQPQRSSNCVMALLATCLVIGFLIGTTTVVLNLKLSDGQKLHDHQLFNCLNVIEQGGNKTGACPDGWRLFNETAQCYKIFEKRRTFDEAEDFCQVENSHLVSIHSWEENYFVYELGREVTQYKLWIGLQVVWRRKEEENSIFVKRTPGNDSYFSWTDGTPLDFESWAVNEPNDVDREENSVEMTLELPAKPQHWNDRVGYLAPHTPTSFVCKMDSKF